MAIDVRIPTILRPYTGGERSVDGNGSTVSAVIEDLEGRFNGIRERWPHNEAAGCRKYLHHGRILLLECRRNEFTVVHHRHGGAQVVLAPIVGRKR